MDYVLLSGGLDSTVLIAALHQEHPNIKAVYVNHGQKGSHKEQFFAELSSFSDVIGGRPGIGTSAAIALNAGILMAKNWIAWAGGKSIALALHGDDLEGRPWLRELFAKYMEGVNMIQPSLTGIPPGGDEFAGMTLHFPFENMSKADVIQVGINIGVDLSETMTCQFEDSGHCGRCYLCGMRRDAFHKAKTADPTKYLAN